jgi:acetylornithine deacetylase/succinyl-diaminopimelate desuccinylase-like protein
MKPPVRIDATKLATRIDSVRAEFESRLGALVEIPTVSMEPHRDGDIVRGAELAAQYIRAAGGRADVVPTGGHPMVLGEIKTSNTARWVTIYNHLDVQPARINEGWEREPFQFHKVDGRYEGRGTTDDKGPALVGLYAAKLAVEDGVPLNFRFIWEMEEEIGSPHFESFVRSRKDALRTDSVLVSDTIWIARQARDLVRLARTAIGDAVARNRHQGRAFRTDRRRRSQSAHRTRHHGERVL